MKIILILCAIIFSPLAHAEKYMVDVEQANLRLTPNFGDKDNNIVSTLNEGTQLDLIQDHGDYIEVQVSEGDLKVGKKGFIKKNLVESFSTYDGVDKDAASPLNVGQPKLPVCACTNCRRSSKYGIRKHPITGRRRLHAGCDIAAPKGTNVYAAAAGIVKAAGVNGGYGKAIDLEHRGELKEKDGKVLTTKGYTTRYGHLWKILVNKGQRVDKGQLIGKVDSTGRSTGHHLHFEIAVSARPRDYTINPERVIDVADSKNNCSGADSSPTDTKK